jgi:hypothetical protein
MAKAIAFVKQDSILRIKVALNVMLGVLIVKKKTVAYANQDSTSIPKNSSASNVRKIVQSVFLKRSA